MGHAYHVWFSTKGRKNAFESELGEGMKRLVLDIAKDNGIHIVELAGGGPRSSAPGGARQAGFAQGNAST